MILEISMACDLSFWAFFFYDNYDGNKYISFQDLHDPWGVIFQNFRLIFRTYGRGVVDIDLIMSWDRPAAARRCACFLLLKKENELVGA